MVNHTPGPWEITRLKGELDNAYWIGPEEYTTIAKVEHGADDEEYGGPKAQLANAMLIAAAPELLEALSDLFDSIGTSSINHRCYAAMTKAYAAIIKANSTKG